MRYRWSVLLVVALAWLAVAPASAQTLCWVLTPDPDQVFLSLVQPDPTVGSWQISATWRRGADYTLVGAGHADLLDERALVDLSFDNATEHFNANPNGRLHLSLDLETLSGPYAVTFTGPNPPHVAAGVAEWQGIFTPCEALLAVSSDGGQPFAVTP